VSTDMLWHLTNCRTIIITLIREIDNIVMVYFGQKCFVLKCFSTCVCIKPAISLLVGDIWYSKLSVAWCHPHKACHCTKWPLICRLYRECTYTAWDLL